MLHMTLVFASWLAVALSGERCSLFLGSGGSPQSREGQAPGNPTSRFFRWENSGGPGWNTTPFTPNPSTQWTSLSTVGRPQTCGPETA